MSKRISFTEFMRFDARYYTGFYGYAFFTGTINPT